MVDIETIAKKIVEIRKKPLLILYYPEDLGTIINDDVHDVYEIIFDKTAGNKIEEMDVILHTNGGNPYAAYGIIQAIREFSDKVTILVPYNAYSGGTLLCLGANKILMGACATLSPIDITLRSPGRFGIEGSDDDIPLICIDNYVEFTKFCKNKIEENLDYATNIEEKLLLKFVKDIGVIKIAEYFRERDATRHYANILLSSYMFPDTAQEEITNTIADALVYKFPSHGFEIDYTIANDLGLIVEKMTPDLSNQAKSLILELHNEANEGNICNKIDEEYKMPYIQYLGCD